MLAIIFFNFRLVARIAPGSTRRWYMTPFQGFLKRFIQSPGFTRCCWYYALSGLTSASSWLTAASKKIIHHHFHTRFSPLTSHHSLLIFHPCFSNKLFINLLFPYPLFHCLMPLTSHHSLLTLHSCFYIKLFIDLVRPALAPGEHGVCFIIVFKSFFDGIPVQFSF